jgi:hypothetical protein
MPVIKQPEVVAAKPLPKPVIKQPEVVAAQPLPKPVIKQPEVVAAKPLPEVLPKQADVASAQAIQLKANQTATKNTADTTTQQAATAVAASLEQQKTTANKALQAAKQGDASGSASWKEKQKQLALEITALKAEQKPEMGRKVKAFADGSMLIDTNPGCWKVPPAESRKNAIWLSTSVPCKADTTVEQINDILQKRRTYSND